MAKAQTAREFDQRFDQGEDIFDLAEIKPEDVSRPGSAETKRINIDLPNDFLAQLDREAARRGITRQSLIKVWLYERLHYSGLLGLHTIIIDRKSGEIVFSDLPIQSEPARHVPRSSGQKEIVQASHFFIELPPAPFCRGGSAGMSLLEKAHRNFGGDPHDHHGL